MPETTFPIDINSFGLKIFIFAKEGCGSRYGFCLAEAPAHVRDDEEVALAAVQQFGYAIWSQRSREE